MSLADAMTIEQPATCEEVAALVREGRHILPAGGGTKSALSVAPTGYVPLSLRGLTGIVEYQPAEFTITARAGTSLRELEETLAAHGQYLPWDPPFVDAGATLGGAIAAGLSGSGRYRYGGLRDFLVGIRFVDGQGRVVRGGGKVVKNAAGFDLPKLFVGSMGRLGVLLEATFKVFPKPPAWTTLRLEIPTAADAQTLVARVGHAPLDVNALDLECTDDGHIVLWLRVGGLAAALPERMARLQMYVGGGEIVSGAEETRWWQETASLAGAEGSDSLLYASLLPSRLAEVDAALAGLSLRRRYICGGTIAWIAAAEDQRDSLADLLARLSLPAVSVRGNGALLHGYQGRELLQRVKHVLDPNRIFPDFFAS